MDTKKMISWEENQIELSIIYDAVTCLSNYTQKYIKYLFLGSSEDPSSAAMNFQKVCTITVSKNNKRIHLKLFKNHDEGAKGRLYNKTAHIFHRKFVSQANQQASNRFN